MIDYFHFYKKQVDASIIDFLREQKQRVSVVNPWGTDIIDHLMRFVVSGKTIRGSLMLWTLHMFSRPQNEADIRIAASMELVHSGFLIHDDIMDNDELRRGQPTIHMQYEEVARKKGIGDPQHFGQSMGICAADICFFLAQKLLATGSIDDKIRKEIVTLCAREYVHVCIAQMRDVSWSYSRTLPKEGDILQLYRYKTARYTFSLPFMVGALLANQPKDVIRKLENLGEIIGILYQIRDDELSICGTPKQTGKPVGGDTRENKKTLRFVLQHTVSTTTLRNLRNDYERRAKHIITSLRIPHTHTQTLLDFLSYVQKRSS